MKRLRSIGLVTAQALALATAAQAETKRPAVGALPSPVVVEGETGSVVALRSPEPPEVLFRGGVFTMGSEPTVALEALDLCNYDLHNAEACGFPLANELLPIEELVQNEVAPHPVTVSAFWMDRTEVTVEAYDRCVVVGACTSTTARRVTASSRLLPVTNVSHDEAQAYCGWRRGRLPTEAEWERAARGLRGRRFPWGNDLQSRAANHGTMRLIDGDKRLFPGTDDSDGFVDLAPVGSFPAGRTPEGLEDMAGNVAEWVLDNYADRYDPVSAHDPKGPLTSPFRVIRGGSYISGPSFLRGASRSFASPGVHHTSIGFRCARPG